MPTPFGHALAGLTVAWTLLPGSAPGPRDGWSRWRIPAACAALAVAPDLDILVTTHRAAWHSLASALVVSGMAWGLLTSAGGAASALRARLAIACGAVWASHVALDWLGKDGSAPFGVMALWPVSRDYVISGLEVFAEVSRRYWEPSQFVWGNLAAVARELLILGPIAALAYWNRRRPG